MHLGEEHGATRPAAHEIDNAPQQTVWQHDDEAMRRLGDSPSALHWSQQNTQPFIPRWPMKTRKQLAARRDAVIARRESRALGIGAGLGALLALVALSLALLLAIANGWLPGGSPAITDPGQGPIPVQSASHTPLPYTPGATSVPTVTAQPTTTAVPTATAQPTATVQPTATPRPTATP